MKSAPWLLAPPGELVPGRVIVLDPAEARHVSGALRLRAGQGIVLANGAGKMAEADLVRIEKKRVEAEVVRVEESPPQGGNGVTLAVAVVGNKAMDWAVQKAVEVGVRVFVPVLSERSQPSKRELASRLDHWRRVALQSIKQCHRPWAMAVPDACSLAELIEREGSEGGGVVADRGGCPVAALPQSAGRLLLIGPEGGFSPPELKEIGGLHWPRLRLGPHILRTETAVAVGGALLVTRDDQISGCESGGLNSADE